jgi:hypothetical protein
MVPTICSPYIVLGFPYTVFSVFSLESMGNLGNSREDRQGLCAAAARRDQQLAAITLCNRGSCFVMISASHRISLSEWNFASRK